LFAVMQALSLSIFMRPVFIDSERKILPIQTIKLAYQFQARTEF
jgi:hypothetical protein